MAKNIKEQIVLSEEESRRLQAEATKQDRSKSNLGRRYILDGLKKDEVLSKPQKINLLAPISEPFAAPAKYFDPEKP